MASRDGSEITENDIAIVGMAARLPGAPTIADYWKNLRDGVESVKTYTREELLEAGESEEAIDHPAYVPAGAPLQGVELFDPELFGFSPKEAGILDPQHRQFTEVCWEALENACHPPDRIEGNVGVFAGVGMGAYFAFNILNNRELVDSVGLFLLRHTGNDKDFLATRVSYLLDLKGPSVNVQTACSTSLVATHLGVQSLLSGEVDFAIAGGVTIEVPHRRGYIYKEGEVLSPDGHCHAFDHRGQGTVFGSGAGAVVLRRATEALEDDDHIHAIIRGTAINNDGASKVGYLAPSVDGQAAAMAEAYAVADVSAETIDYVECHGTGTYMGDPIEVSGLTQAFRQTTEEKGFCRIGSVKTNIGHLDTAAGVASLIKVALSLQNAQMPPSLNFESPNPNIDFENSPFVVNSELTPWKRRGHPRRGAVNSLGVGGTNAHAVLQEAPKRKPGSKSKKSHQLLMINGRTRKAVEGNAQRLADHLEAHPELDLADVAYTLHVGRKLMDNRRVVAVSSHEEAIKLLRDNDRQRVFTHAKVGDSPKTVFMMPGGGAHYGAMGRDLYASEPVYKEWIDRGVELLKKKKGLDLKAYLVPAAGKEAEAAEYLDGFPQQLPAIFIVSYAMAKLLESRGVKPDAFIGHSLGENTAACLAGIFQYEETLELVHLRASLQGTIEGGGVTSVQLGKEALQPYLDELGLDLAGENTPELCTVSGPVEALEALERQLEAKEIDARRVNVPVPAHSRMFDSILDEFRDFLKTMKLAKPKIPVISNHTGTWLTDEEATSPDYWARHLRGTVRFAEGMKTLLEEEQNIYLEVGPGRMLSSLARQQPDASPALPAISTMRHPDQKVHDGAWLLTALGRLWASGHGLDVANLWKGERRLRVELPTYAFQHSAFWIEPSAGAGAARPAGISKSESVEDFFYRPSWTGMPLGEPFGEDGLTWLVFKDPMGVAGRLATRLRKRGHTVIEVDTGDAYFKADENNYTLAPERGRESYDSLLHDLVASGRTPDRIVHMWLATDEARVRMGSSQFHTHTQYGFYSLFFLLQAIADEGLSRPIHLTALTTGAQQVMGEAMPFFEKALVSGPVKVGPREIEGLTASWVDLEVPSPATLLEVVPVKGIQKLARRPVWATFRGLTDMVEREILAEPVNGTFAWRHGQRYAYSIRTSKPPAGSQSRLHRGGCYFITGGLGGIGLTVAEHLARNYQARLVLTGRSALPPRDEWDGWLSAHGPDEKTSRRILKVRGLESLGAEVMVEELDVTDIETLREILKAAERRFGRIDGLFHAAGVVADDLIQLKTQLSVEDVFGPKVHGTQVLQNALADRDLDFMLLFSSTSTWLAPAGQVDYVAANDLLNAIAVESGTRGKNVVSVGWGIWNEVGLAAESMRSALVGEQPPPESRTPVEHPLIDAKIDSEKGDAVLSTLYSPHTHWLLDEHRTLNGDALVPGTGYLEIARAAVEAFGHARAFEIRDLFFFRPLHVADDETKEVRVFLNRAPEGYALELRSKRQVRGKDGWELHAQARLLLGGTPAAEALDIPAIEARCSRSVEKTPEGAASSQAVHLSFGPRWLNLREARYGRYEAIARLSLPEENRAEAAVYKLHPALLDIATGYAMKLIEGYDASSLWVPVSYEKVRYLKPMPAEIVSWVKAHGENIGAHGIATFDIVIAGLDGEVALEVEGFSIRDLGGKLDFATTDEPSRSEIRMEDSPQERQLSPAEEALRRNMERGIRPAEGMEALERILSADELPTLVTVSSMPVEALMEQQEQLASESTDVGGTKFDRPDLDSEYVEPRDDVEKTVVGFWEDLLGVNKVGVKDSFFDLGGHSLIAVRLFAKIKQTYSVDYPISILFEAPTVERCAEMIREAIGEEAAAATTDIEESVLGLKKPSKPGPRYMHLVPMHKGEGGPKRPFFLVAGMFGNVLNLVHLANLIGSDRPFYGLQARGLYGDAAPHETFEEAAADYIRELKEVQPKGPYLVGGFSGGGITAWEIAQQLTAAGDEVAMLLLLDSRLPQPEPLRASDRARMKAMDFQRNGPTYIAEWTQSRVAWELGKLRRRFLPTEEVIRPTPTSFQNEAIEAAFYRALERYEMRPFPGRVHLYRPKLDPMYVVSPERWIDDEDKYMFYDNGFGKYSEDIEVYEMPGNHDSMVLEPNVRIMARRLKRHIERVELEVQCRERGVEPPPRDQREVELAHERRGPADFTAR